MSKSARRLGRGLQSLVSTSRTPAPSPEVALPVAGVPKSVEVPRGRSAGIDARMLPIEDLYPNPFQPRDTIDDATILSLAESIKRSGILQPITVRNERGRLEIIAGERRWRAASRAGLSRIPAIIRDATDQEMLELALVENLQREDLNAIDRAAAYRDFCSRFGLRPEEVAERLGEDRTTVVNYLRLLDLPEALQALVRGGRLSMGHARCLLGVRSEIEQERLAQASIQNELSVRALEEIVRRKRSKESTSGQPQVVDERPRSAHLLDLQRRFEEALKTKVLIQEGRRKGRGRIVIEYYSLDDFDRISAQLGVPVE